MRKGGTEAEINLLLLELSYNDSLRKRKGLLSIVEDSQKLPVVTVNGIPRKVVLFSTVVGCIVFSPR